MGDGAPDPARAEIHNIIKYHGPASDDPDMLYEQTHTILVAASEDANAVDLGEPFGVHCFDPQAAPWGGPPDGWRSGSWSAWEPGAEPRHGSAAVGEEPWAGRPGA